METTARCGVREVEGLGVIEEPKDIYIGVTPCGCVVAACVNKSAHFGGISYAGIAKVLAGWERDGLKVELTTGSDMKARIGRCTHGHTPKIGRAQVKAEQKA